MTRIIWGIKVSSLTTSSMRNHAHFSKSQMWSEISQSSRLCSSGTSRSQTLSRVSLLRRRASKRTRSQVAWPSFRTARVRSISRASISSLRAQAPRKAPAWLRRESEVEEEPLPTQCQAKNVRLRAWEHQVVAEAVAELFERLDGQKVSEWLKWQTQNWSYWSRILALRYNFLRNENQTHSLD